MQRQRSLKRSELLDVDGDYILDSEDEKTS
nr:MAG TPA: hypothetical protein [Caudoviricetes sp.]